MSIDDVIFLRPVERVSLDPSAFHALIAGQAAANGAFHADDLFEEFIVCLSAIETAWLAGEFERLGSQAAMLRELAEGLGLAQVSIVAHQLTSLLRRSDDVALAAVVSRVVRVGEASLTSALEYAYRRI